MECFFCVDMFFKQQVIWFNNVSYGLNSMALSTNPDTIFGVPQDSLSIKNHPIGMHPICTQLPHDVF